MLNSEINQSDKRFILIQSSVYLRPFSVCSRDSFSCHLGQTLKAWRAGKVVAFYTIHQGPAESQTAARFLLSWISHSNRVAAGTAGTLVPELHVRTRERSQPEDVQLF